MTAPDDFEEPLVQAHRLVRHGKAEEACQLLLRAQEEALAAGQLEHAALFCSVRGSYLVAMGRDGEALTAHRLAEQLSGSDVHYRLTTSAHLIGMGRPTEGLEIVDQILEEEPASPAVLQEAHALRGSALLALDRPAQAVEELRAIHSQLHSLHGSSLALDLSLVEELARRHLAPSLCRHYLELVAERASRDGEKRVLDKVLQIQHLLE